MKTNLLKNITLPIEKCVILLYMPQAEAGPVVVCAAFGVIAFIKWLS